MSGFSTQTSKDIFSKRDAVESFGGITAGFFNALFHLTFYHCLTPNSRCNFRVFLGVFLQG